MNQIQSLLEMLRDTDATAKRMAELAAANPRDDALAINAEAIKKRRADLARRLTDELRVSQTDLVQYHVERPDVDRYPVVAVAKAIAGFQELVTSVFDAIRSSPKKKYRPSPENVELSTLDFAMALPIGSVVVSMHVENDRLIAIKSELDQTFERVFQILKTRNPEQLRELADQVGIASISKAHDWAASTAEFGLNTSIAVQKDLHTEPLDFSISKAEAELLKEAIEEKSDRETERDIVSGELIGIDVDKDQNKSKFHIKTLDGRNLEGKLAETFPKDQHWAVHEFYEAHLLKVTTIKYATGEEKVDWLLAGLLQIDRPKEGQDEHSAHD